MFNFVKLTLCCLLLVLIQACAPVINFNVENIQPIAKKIDGDLRRININLPPENSSFPLTCDHICLIVNWKSSLEKALKTSKVFNDNSSRKLDLEVNILKYESIFFESQIKITSEYVISDRNSEAVISKIVVDSTGQASELMGGVRASKSLMQSVQNNISDYLVKLGRE